jgi:hypothetical protein
MENFKEKDYEEFKNRYLPFSVDHIVKLAKNNNLPYGMLGDAIYVGIDRDWQVETAIKDLFYRVGSKNLVVYDGEIFFKTTLNPIENAQLTFRLNKKWKLPKE